MTWLTLLLFIVCSTVLASADENKETFSDYFPFKHLYMEPTNRNPTRSMYFDYIPSEWSNSSHPKLEIRSPFLGNVRVVETAQFGISVNLKARSVLDLSGVDFEYTAIGDTGTLLLQLKPVPTPPVGDVNALIKLGIVAGALTAIVFVITLAYLCFWMSKFNKKPERRSRIPNQENGSMSASMTTDSMADSQSHRSWNDWPTEDLVEDLLRDDLDPGTPPLSNGDTGVYRPNMSKSRSTADSTSRHSRKRHRYPISHKSRQISSSEDISSLDDSWTHKKKAAWRNAQGSRRMARFSDLDGTSGDAGFSSCNEGSKNQAPRHQLSNLNSSAEELEWDEYGTKADDVNNMLPPPPEDPWLLGDPRLDHAADVSDISTLPPPEYDAVTSGSAMANIDDVRQAISNAMSSVNREAANTREGNPESPHDDGYETGLNGQRSKPVLPSKLSTSSSTRSPQSSGGGNAPGKLQVTAMLVVCTLGLAAASFDFSSISTEIVVFVPDNFFKSIDVYINDTSLVDLDMQRKPENTAVFMFDAKAPVLTDTGRNLCEADRGCEHSCDRQTGLCVCSKGYLLYDTTKCSDKNDCLYLPCHPTEKCINNIGGYTCVCGKDWWRDPSSGECVHCGMSKCPRGTFESSSCPTRVCSECTSQCPENHYISSPCTNSRDTQCEPCSAPCADDEFEFKPCMNQTNRKCNAISSIPKARGSSNLLMESMTDRRGAETRYRLLTPHQSQEFKTDLMRSSNITFQISVRSANLSPSIRAKPHPDSNDNDVFKFKDGAKIITDEFCPFPMPVKYELIPVLHNDVTAAKSSNCPECAVDPKEECRTYKQFGRSPPLHPHNMSMVCTEPGLLADLFNLNAYLTESKSLIVPPSESCELLQSKCDECSKTCAEDIASETTGNCMITSDDGRDRWSPRLMNCQNCCLNNQCRELCSFTQNCIPTSCWNGNVAEFLLSAFFPTRVREFYCNMRLDESEPLLALDYTVRYNNRELASFSILLNQTEDLIKSKIYSDGLLKIRYETGIYNIPDIIHGQLNMQSLEPEFNAAKYDPQQNRNPGLSSSRLDIVPKNPFEFSTMWWGDQSCSQHVIDKMVVSGNSSAFKAQDTISVRKKSSYTYTLWNRTQQPSIKFEVPTSISVIKKLFEPTEVNMMDMEAVVTRHQSGWKIDITGSVQICPGYFQVKVWETNRTVPLADYELAVYETGQRPCNQRFSLLFDIPGGDVSRIERSFRVEFIFGSGRRYIIEAKSSNPQPEHGTIANTAPVMDYPDTPKRSTMLILGPYLLIMGVTIIVFSIAWIVSIVIPRNHGPVTSWPSTRALMTMFYVLHRVFYVLMTSFSVFAFIWITANGSDIKTVQSYTEGIQTVISQQQYDLRALVDYSTSKVGQQQDLFRKERAKCFEGITKIQLESQQLVQKLSKSMNDKMRSLPVRNDEIVNQIDEKVRKLQSQLENQRLQYNMYAASVSENLHLQISQTLQDVGTSPWLSGAQIIRNRVLQMSFSDPVSDFQQWIGLKQTLRDISADFTMDPLPTIEVDTLALPKMPEPPVFTPVNLDNVFLPYHELYSEIKAPLVSTHDSGSHTFARILASRVSFVVVVSVLCAFDLLSVICRTANTLETCQLILDGYYLEKTYSKAFDDGCSSEKYLMSKLKKKPNRVRYKLYKLILETQFVPIVIGTLMATSFTYAFLHIGLDFVSMERLSQVGLFSSLIGPWNLSSNIAADSIEMNVQRINTVDLPSFQGMYNHYIERVELLNHMYNNISYYIWQVECGSSPSDRCQEFQFEDLVPSLSIRDIQCDIKPLGQPDLSDMPAVMSDTKARAILLPYIISFRRMLETTACLVIMVICYILMVKMASAVFWNFLTRLGILPGVRVKIMNRLPKLATPERTRASSDNFSSHMQFSDGVIEEVSDEGSLDSSRHVGMVKHDQNQPVFSRQSTLASTSSQPMKLSDTEGHSSSARINKNSRFTSDKQGLSEGEYRSS